MSDHEMNDGKPVVDEDETFGAEGETPGDAEEQLREANEKYLRLYAEFDNYRKRVSKDKEEILRYGNESLLSELLTVVDHLEMALKHGENEASRGLVQGVEITLKDLLKTLEKFGVKAIEAEGKEFDPSVHHAMAQVERDDMESGMVVEEFRKGYMLREKVLRPALVAVSKRPSAEEAEAAKAD